ncbi:mannose-1-phosphate guanylyltransferase/mannose-6-phosphate isomerase [Entomomonas sp. E2T0]|uniref:mannose-1-phosphate guanylyltransferase/mannose-6-phosphate isomerase n=1 Tax=Entomomonas sp. E2T0 TaxID=2930213 RepID=UPI0022282938|nr:mannose-1-phosphate guanylyltransferase/mannose-6-phosphate isomerase [Entomomonas sp. E2T0]UYZ83235.1 mannose-1-phosphate guanylyltransferase/mannose-6-phosphate isomerase [Entomomonas sp. E2T0]
MVEAMEQPLVPVIMSGGSGTRLWPLSRQTKPKQFLALVGEYSLLQDTINRLDGINKQEPIVICNEAHRFLVAEQLRQLEQKATILLEPVGRNTAPAVALAAFKVYQQNPNAILLVLAADHLIQNTKVFQQVVSNALELAKQDYLVTFGIVPTAPETGYGYIEQGAQIAEGSYQVKQFIEKPSQTIAEEYLQAGHYCWNSGMFMFTAKTYLAELEKYRPDIYKACKQAMQSPTVDLDFIRIDKEAFLGCPADSIDYAVMEKTDKAVVVSLDAGWTDIGSWSALWQVTNKDSQGNTLKGDVLVEQTTNTLVYANDRLVTTLGVDNLVIVETKDAVLVAAKNKIQQVKDIVARLQQAGRIEAVQHSEVHRPWGIYDCIDIGERYQVKRITVKPGAKLSLQKHHHRAEHWVIVKGTAKITKNSETYLLTEDQSTYIPIGEIHSLENPGKIPLELIEVQSGSYLGEDDIIRLEDKYGR